MTAGSPSFASDNNAGVHPAVLAAVAEANRGHAPSYGNDPVTAQARALFRAHFGDRAEVVFVFNGTGANVVALSAMLRPYESVLCAETAHIAVDECGAPERFIGGKLVGVPAPGGKLTPPLVAAAASGTGDPHHVQPKVVSIAESTELGTVYTLDEIRALAAWAHERGMLLHVDGARLANAAVSLGVELSAFAECGIDVLSFGGTKNGALGAEAVVFLDPGLAAPRAFLQKQAMQLSSKMRFVSAQFVALLEADLWRANAAHANAMARRLAAAVADLPGVALAHPVQANAVFVTLPGLVAETLQRRYDAAWDGTGGLIRWMTAFDTTPEQVDAFAAAVRDATMGDDGRHHRP